MTTIACNREMMASDSLVTRGNVRSRVTRPKVTRVHGGLLGLAGISASCELFALWFAGGRDIGRKPELDQSFTALYLRADGEILVFHDECVGIPVYEQHHAIGSGWQIALGAMAAGANPEEAIAICCELELKTGPPVIVCPLVEQEFKVTA